MNDIIQQILLYGALISLLWGAVLFIIKVYRWKDNKDKMNSEIKNIKEEQEILTIGVLACLKGLKEQGCNGPVTEAISLIEKHLNKKAHE